MRTPRGRILPHRLALNDPMVPPRLRAEALLFGSRHIFVVSASRPALKKKSTHCENSADMMSALHSGGRFVHISVVPAGKAEPSAKHSRLVNLSD